MRPSNCDALDLIERELIAAPIVKFVSSASMRGSP
jgi:hypothetical protein